MQLQLVAFPGSRVVWKQLKWGWRIRTGCCQFSDDQVEDEQESDDGEADVDHEAAVAAAGPDHVVQAVDRAPEQTETEIKYI